MMMDDQALLEAYARDKDQNAFSELVGRHLPTVYGVALRKLNGDTHLAEDVAQSVFIDLSRKAHRLGAHQVLAGWLFTSTHFAACKAVRSEQRRRIREMETTIMPLATDGAEEPRPEDWERMRPLLDDLLNALGERDRDALLLRFFEGCAYPEMAARLQVSVDGARSRVDRALERLRGQLARRGIRSSVAALATGLAGQAACAAPDGLATSISAAVHAAGLAGGAGAGAAAGKTILMTTSHKIILASVVALVAAGIAVHQKTEARSEEYQLTQLQERLGRAQSELSDANARLAACRREIAAVESERAAAAAARATSPSASRDGATSGVSAPGRTGGQDQPRMDTPEHAGDKQVAFTIERLHMANAVVPLLPRLELSDAQLAQFAAFAAEELPAERFALVRLIDDYRREMEEDWRNGLRAILGEESFARLEAAQAAQTEVVKLANHLAPGDTPINPDQASRLLETIASYREAAASTGAGANWFDDLAPELAAILSPAQLAEWRRLNQANEIRENIVNRLRDLDAGRE